MSTTGNTSETGFTALFIRRPVMAFVLNTLIAEGKDLISPE